MEDLVRTTWYGVSVINYSLPLSGLITYKLLGKLLSSILPLHSVFFFIPFHPQPCPFQSFQFLMERKTLDRKCCLLSFFDFVVDGMWLRACWRDLDDRDVHIIKQRSYQNDLILLFFKMCLMLYFTIKCAYHLYLILYL